MSPLLQLHNRDNVAVALVQLHAQQSVNENVALLVLEEIAPMHKVAIKKINKGNAIFKYGQAIGVALADIPAGSLVHDHNCGMLDKVQNDYEFCSRTPETKFAPTDQLKTFEGYVRANGKVGTRNYIGIISTVNCSATAASQIAHTFEYSGILNEFNNVDGVVALSHESGCGMRAAGDGYELLKRTLLGYAEHPNFGGILLLGLGCETMQLQRLLGDRIDTQSTVFQAFNIQDTAGTRASIERGIALIKDMLPEVNQATRQTVAASELKVAVQCGGSDAFSGITANPAIGAAGDIVVAQGGTLIYSETPEIYGAEHLLLERARNPEVAQQLVDRIHWWEDYTQRNGFELNNNPSPGNKQGGLTTIIEKSLGAQAKSGSTALNAVYQYAEQVKEKGLVFMDSPGFDPVSVTGQVASGANIVCFTTGRGSAFGFKPVPSIKLVSNNELYQQMKDDIDINCGGIISGEQNLESLGKDIFEQILAVASGKLTKSEELGYGLNEFNPWKIGAVV